MLVPVGIGIINGDKGGGVRRWGVCKGILSITTINFVALECCECKEQALHGLFHTRGVGGGQSVEGRGGTEGSITAVARSAGSILLDGVGPVGTKDDGTRGSGNRGSIHAEGMEMVQLFAFAIDPLGPGVKLLKFVAGEAAKGLFSGGDGLGLDGIEQESNLVSGNSLLGEVDVREPDSSDGTDISNRKDRCVVVVGGKVGLVEVSLSVNPFAVSSGEAALRGILDREGG